MNHVTLTYDQADNFVTRQRGLGSNVHWDGWTLVYFTPVERARFSNKGVFYNDKWGFEHRIEVDSLGIWSVPVKYVRSARRTRNRS